MTEARSSSSWSPWALAAVAAIALAGLYWLLSGPQTDQVAVQPAPATTEGRAVSTPDASTAQLTQQATTSVAGLRSALQDLTMPGSADAALPKLREAAAEIDRLSARAAQLPPEGKKQVAGVISAAMPSINTLLEKALADPTIAALARPVIEPLRAKLASLTAV